MNIGEKKTGSNGRVSSYFTPIYWKDKLHKHHNHAQNLKHMFSFVAHWQNSIALAM